MTGRAFKSASYDFSDQRFANKRAYRDAQERVAKAVADDIAARVAGFFRKQFLDRFAEGHCAVAVSESRETSTDLWQIRPRRAALF